MSTGYTVCPRYLKSSAGEIFVIAFQPDGHQLGTVLIVPPFAEEMNRARPTMSVVAKQLAESGYLVVLPDLFGTGDSGGDFSEASWRYWQEDLATVSGEFLESSKQRVSVIAIRLGALLFLDTDVGRKIDVERLFLWDPIATGRSYMDQFLRLRSMSGLLSQSVNREKIEDLRSLLASGQTLEVAGYELTPGIVSSIDELKLLESFDSDATMIAWINTVASDDSRSPVASQRIVNELENTGYSVKLRATMGPRYWQVPENIVAREIIDATLKSFARS